MDSIFCVFFWACELVNDVPRADQWMRSAAELMQRRTVAAAACRAHYGGILTAAGRWEEAETQLLESTRQFDRGMAGRRAMALIRLADLRLRQGRLEGAAQLLEGLDAHPDAARTLAALHLAQGETALARDLLERCTAGSDDDVPAIGAMTTVGPLLALLVDVRLDEGDLDGADRTARRLRRLAQAQHGPYLKAALPWPRGGCTWPVGRATSAAACTRRWRASHGRSCRWSWRARGWRWRGRCRRSDPRWPSQRRRRRLRTSNASTPLGTPTRPGRCSAHSVPPSEPAPRASAR